MDAERGKIQNADRARQLRDFSGLRFGTITPTDVDMHIEYHDLVHIFAELKLGNREVQRGQWVALKRLCDDLGKPALLILASHDAYNPNQDIDVAAAAVSWFRFNRQDYKVSGCLTVRAMAEIFISWADKSVDNPGQFIASLDAADTASMPAKQPVVNLPPPPAARPNVLEQALQAKLEHEQVRRSVQLPFALPKNNYSE